MYVEEKGRAPKSQWVQCSRFEVVHRKTLQRTFTVLAVAFLLDPATDSWSHTYQIVSIGCRLYDTGDGCTFKDDTGGRYRRKR